MAYCMTPACGLIEPLAFAAIIVLGIVAMLAPGRHIDGLLVLLSACAF